MDRRPGSTSPAWPARAGMAAITAYQRLLSPWLGARCRLLPSCSAYAREAIERFGLARGTWLALGRILRCQPLCEGGYDPVPESFAWFPARHGH